MCSLTKECVLFCRYNCIGVSVSHTAAITLRDCTLFAHSEGAIQVGPEQPGAQDSRPACTLHLLRNRAFVDNSQLVRERERVCVYLCVCVFVCVCVCVCVCVIILVFLLWFKP